MRRLPESSVRPEAGLQGRWEAAASGTGVLREALVPKRRQVPRGRSHGSHGVPPATVQRKECLSRTLVLGEAHAGVQASKGD